MDNTKVDGQQELAEGTAPVMPTETKPTVDSQVPDSKQASEEPKLPEGVKERTAQEFEKLKAHNRQLADELSKVKGQVQRPASVLDDLTPQPIVPQVPVQAPQEQYVQPQQLQQQYQNLSQEQIQNVAQQLVDKDGYVDTNVLNQTLYNLNVGRNQAIESARRAEERARSAEERVSRFEQTQVTQKLHAEFPQADPYSASFDPAFYEHLKKELVYQMTQGKQNPLEAAKLVTSYYNPVKTKAPEEVKREEAVAQRQQVVSPQGIQRGVSTKMDEESLVKGTRTGNVEAINERLRRAGY